MVHAEAKVKIKEWKPLGHFPLWCYHPSLPRADSCTICQGTGKSVTDQCKVEISH